MTTGLTAQECRALDQQAAQQYGIPTLLLMEHAGLAVVRTLQQRGLTSRARVVCLAGRGHNGGDGLAAMRLLAAHGGRPTVFLLGCCDALTGDVALYAQMAERSGMALHELIDEPAWQRCRDAMAQADWIIDALLGTGFSGALKPEPARAIHLMNAAGRPILAVDTPSGLDVDTGAVTSVAVRATVTVTFGLPKQGFVRGEGPRHVGELVVDSITFPPGLLAAYQTR